MIRDADGEIFTVSNYGDSLVELRCATRESKVTWLAHLYQVSKYIFIYGDSLLELRCATLESTVTSLG